jgi:hypothetical protein
MTTLEKTARMTEQDIAVLKAMFEDREGAAEVIRKIFYPELTADAPIRLNQSMWSSCHLAPDMTPEQKIIAVESHQKLMQHVEGCLGVIKTLIGKKGETAEQVLARLQRDSAK